MCNSLVCGSCGPCPWHCCWPKHSCIPSVGWLPDSSGFIYAGGEKFEKPIFYDVAKEKHTCWWTAWKGTGLQRRPDGQPRRQAHRRHGGDGEAGKSLEAVVFDLQGKELHRYASRWSGERPGTESQGHTGCREKTRLLVDD